MDFLMWYDDSREKTAVEKIQEAIAAYIARFTIVPVLVLVNAVDFTEVDGLSIYPDRRVKPDNFWVGHEGSELYVPV